MRARAATEALARLDVFTGEWETEGVTAAGEAFRASDSYEWVADGHFLLHRFDADMPAGRMQGIEVIGYDAVRNVYPMHAFDTSGSHSMMHAVVEDDTWTFEGENMQFTGAFRDEGTIFAGAWESRDGESSEWTPAMTITLRKKR